MIQLIIAVGIAVVVGGVLLMVVLCTAARVVREAYGRTLYSNIGAWMRIREFARTQGKIKYIGEAESRLEVLEQDLRGWHEGTTARGSDIARFEKLRAAAYDETDKQIKDGQNPLAYLDAP